MTDPINPDHYREHPSGVECIEITEHMNFCLGNAVKYIWRAGLKSPNPLQDLTKAAWYIDREIERLRQYYRDASDKLADQDKEALAALDQRIKEHRND